LVAKDINQSLDNIKNVSQSTQEGVQQVSDANIKMGQKLIDIHTSLNRFQL